MSNGYTEHILKEIAAERWRQRQEFSIEHDERLSPGQWIGIGCRHLGLAMLDGGLISRKVFRQQLIRCAAVCAAAVEAIDRQMDQALGEEEEQLIARNGTIWLAKEQNGREMKPGSYDNWLLEQAQEMANRAGEVVLIVPEGAESSVTGYPSPVAFLTLLSQAEKAHVARAKRIEPQPKEVQHGR